MIGSSIFEFEAKHHTISKILVNFAGVLTISGYDYSEKKQFLVDAILNTDVGAKTIYPASIVNGVGLNELDIVGRWPRPIAVIAGENDAAINNEYIMHQVKFLNLWKNKVHVIRDVGHAVHMENAKEFNRILNAFLRDVFYSVK